MKEEVKVIVEQSSALAGGIEELSFVSLFIMDYSYFSISVKRSFTLHPSFFMSKKRARS